MILTMETILELGQVLFKERMKNLEPRAFILGSSVYKNTLPLPTTMTAVDHVETCLKAAVETWTGEVNYDHHGSFVQSVVRTDWEEASNRGDAINQTFMDIYKLFVSLHVPLAIIEHYKKYS